MGVLPAIAAIISAWPETVKFINRIADAFTALQKMAQEKDLQNWLQDLEKAQRGAETATTLEEKINAAKALSDIIRRLG